MKTVKLEGEDAVMTFEKAPPAGNVVSVHSPNWRVTFTDNDGNTVSVEIYAVGYDEAISKASQKVHTVYFKNAVRI